jgi:anti-sigma factor RsiW
MKCKDTGKLIIDKLAGELSPRQAAKLDKHLTSCDTCRKEFEALSKAWQFSNETLKEDTFVKELNPAKRSEIFSIAQNEAKRQRSSRRLTRLVEYLAIFAICLILAGMMLPALNQAREKSSNTLAQSRIKMAKLAEMQKEMDVKNAGSDDYTVRDEIGNESTVIAESHWRTPSVDKSKKRRAELLSPAAAPMPAMPASKTATAWTASMESADRISGVSNTLGSSTKYEYANKLKIKKKSWRAGATSSLKPISDQEQAKPILITESMMDSDVISDGRIEKKLEKRPALKLARVQEIKRTEPQMLMSSRSGPISSPKRPGSSSCSRSIYATTVTRNIYRAKESRSTLRMVGAQKIFRVNLKLWNMTTISNVKKYLKTNNYPVPNNIIVNKANNTIFIRASKATLEKLDKLFKKLQQEEKELKDLRKGLPFIKCISRPVSTFSIDTDTASYVQARKSIMRGERPNPLKIRPEEFINYFDYNYRSPDNSTFAVYPEAAPSPFRPNNTLFRIGIQGKRLGPNANTRTHYTILLDTSGSMAVKDRMELAKKALAMLVKKLKPSDYVSLLLCGTKTYSVFSIKRLNPRNRQKLLNTLNNVTPRGVADFAKGISKAYSFADKHYVLSSPNRITSRIIIISDGIFELNAAGRQNITTQIEAARKRGISNIVIGLGGDGDDNMLEKVAAIGDGSYVFLDTEREAEELFTTQFEARFREIARDVKIQVEFNPDAVKSYRQIGYKNRQLSKADFRNDKVDAGEVGSGQAVTALYELNLKDNIPKDTIVATVRIRYKKAGDMSVEEKAFYLYENDMKEKFKAASSNFKLASFVAEFAESLRYPETQGIASLRGVADKLNNTWMKHYRKDRKVTELLSLIKRSR